MKLSGYYSDFFLCHFDVVFTKFSVFSEHESMKLMCVNFVLFSCAITKNCKKWTTDQLLGERPRPAPEAKELVNNGILMIRMGMNEFYPPK